MANEADPISVLRRQLDTLAPQVRIDTLRRDALFRDTRFDLVIEVVVGDARKTLLVEIQSSGQPGHLRQAIARFAEMGMGDEDALFVIAAPFIGRRGMEVCRQHKVGCIDMLGNLYLAFDGVYVERAVANPPPHVRRQVKNLFAPVSSRIVRAMLEEPDRRWKLSVLSETVAASLGQVYNISEKLVAEGFAQKSAREGFFLTDPGGLLDLWRDEYDVMAVNRVRGFHSFERDPERVIAAVGRAAETMGHAYALTLHAGASLVAPYVRYNDVHLYAASQVAAWAEALALHPVEFGGNVHLLEPYDRGVFYRARPVQGVSVVGNIQLYLDLYQYPARGREQAEFLREQSIGF